MGRSDVLLKIAESIIETGTMTKSDLVNLLGTSATNTHQLRKRYFDDDFLKEINLNPESYKRVYKFDRIQTKIIIGRLQIHLLIPKLVVLL